VDIVDKLSTENVDNSKTLPACVEKLSTSLWITRKHRLLVWKTSLKRLPQCIKTPLACVDSVDNFSTFIVDNSLFVS